MTANRLNILSLHRLGPPRYWREAVRTLEYMFPQYAGDHNCLVHDADFPLPEYVREIEFHVIVLGPTFLCSRYDGRLFERALEWYDFVRTSGAVKIALPQDEYDCAAILDQWMVNWKVDRVYTVIGDHWDVLFPRYSKMGSIELGYTGYIADEWVEQWRRPREHGERRVDVCYRASKLPAHFGSLGRLKSEIAETFVRGVAGMGLKLDISTDARDMVPGPSWHAFLEDARFCLGTPSGSSLLDPEGEIRRRVKKFTERHPRAEFEEIERECFPGEDRRWVFTAISPRNIEAALCETVQIATRGSYSGLLEPMEHYLPLEEDGSNLKAILEMMRDKEMVCRIRGACKEAVLANKRLHFRNFVAELVNLAQEETWRRGIRGTCQGEVERRMGRYEREFQPKLRRWWRVRERVIGLRDWAGRLGVRRLGELLARLA